MASLGGIEPKLAKCRIPTCVGCLYGKATCKPCHTKGASNSILEPSKPGNVVFIDQLTVTTPGLIGQVPGFLTHERYNYSMVFLDHCSDAPYIVFQRALTGEETVWVKASFEGYPSKHGVKVRHYHTDKGIFRIQYFQADIQLQRQTISYCGVGAHDQNGLVEKLICDIQDQGRMVLLHAKQRWPQAITEHLWPYAYNLCTDISKLTPQSSDGKIPQHIFCGSSISAPAIKTYTPLDAQLTCWTVHCKQGTNKTNWWPGVGLESTWESTWDLRLTTQGWYT